MNKKNTLRIAVIGGGSWGTALAHMLSCKGHTVTMIVRKADLAAHINTHHENPQYMRAYALHEALKATCDASQLVGQDIFVLAISAQHIGTFLAEVQEYLPFGAVIVNASKGLERSTGKTISQTVSAVLSHKAPQYAMLSGPSFAEEVLQGHPTALVLGCATEGLDRALQSAFSSPFFRCYSCADVLGVELGGALKNVIALAAGVCDGLGFGHNARAALVTRGLAEIRRLGVACGAHDATFKGLSGLGDLMLTCTGDLSRNRQVGIRLGQGERLDSIIENLGMVAEGVSTTQAAYNMAKKHKVNAPIIHAMYHILYDELDPRTCVQQLMTRKLTEE